VALGRSEPHESVPRVLWWVNSVERLGVRLIVTT
jgi:hypothetical protein